MINKEYLKSLNPCKDRYAHYLEHYKDFSGSLDDFLDLDKLTHEDKIWVFVRSVDKKIAVAFAADCAKRVLHIYENKYPNDDRPRKAIEAAISGNHDAAYAAARAAYAAADAAARAAYAAACAAADAAYAAADAAYAAARAAYAADAAYAAACAAAYAASCADTKQDEEKEQVKLMKKYARELKGV